MRSPRSELDGAGGLTWRALTAADLGPWMELITRIQDHEGLRERVTVEDLQIVVRQPTVDLAADSLVGIDGDGTFRAFGRNSHRPGSFSTITVHLTGGVDPEWRGRGIGRRLLAWQRSRAEQNVADLRAAAPSAATMPALVGCFVEEQVLDRARLLEAAGHTAVRWFVEMRRTLPTVRAEPDLPDGLTVEPVTADNLEQVRVAHNEAFRGHWGSAAMDSDRWREQFADHPAFRPALSFVVTDRGVEPPQVVGYALNAEFVEDWAAQGFTEGYTETLGVLPAWRGNGLAASLLEASARAFADHGHPYASLTVDADNPVALRLYERLGYDAVHRSVFYGQQA